MKLDWRKTFMIGLGFFGVSIITSLYNSFAPLFLQAGHPDFENTRNALGFGLDKQVMGIIMGLDNIAAIFILPVIGVWSDRVRTRIGRRYPFILSAAPFAIVGFMLLPIASGMILPETNGNLPANQGPFAVFMVGAIVMLLAMSVMRTPVVSLMPDLTPSALRSKANGVINLMGGLAFIVSSFGLARLFAISPTLPFLGGSIMTAFALVLLFFTVKEPDLSDPAFADAHEERDHEQAASALKGFRVVPPAYHASLIFLLLAIFAWFVAYDGLQTLFTSYAVDELGISEDFAPTLGGIAGLTFLLFAIPAGFIGAKFSRRRTIMFGLVTFATLMVIAFFIPDSVRWNLSASFAITKVHLIGLLMGLGGLGWAMVNINSLPMVVDTVGDVRLLGTYTGLYYLASQSGSSLGPFLIATVIELLGGSYNNIFLAAPLFFVLALAAMFFVTRGEAHPPEPAPAVNL